MTILLATLTKVSGTSTVTGGTTTTPTTSAPTITTQAVLNSSTTPETGEAFTITPPAVTGTPTPTITYQLQLDGVNSGTTFTGTAGTYPNTAGVVTVTYTVSNGTAPDATGTSNAITITQSLPIRVATVQNSVPDSTTNAAGYDTYVSRYRHTIAQDTSDLRLSFSNFFMSGSESGVGNNYTVQKVSIENSSGTVVAVNFGGGRTQVVADGASDVKSDPVLPLSFAETKFTKNDHYWVKVEMTVVAGGNVPVCSAYTGFSGTQTVLIGSGATTFSDTDTAGEYTFTNGTPIVKQNGYSPIVLGKVLIDQPSYIAVGDSIGDSASDNGTNEPYGRAFINRSAVETAGSGAGNILPLMNMSKFAIPTTGFTGTNTKWREYIKYARYGIDELGTNDVGGRNFATMSTRFNDLWTILGAGGLEKLFRTSLLARTTSTDSFVTLANQSYVDSPAWEIGGVVDLLNTDWATKQDTTVFGMSFEYVDFQSLTVDPSTRKWLVNGTANYPTTDGVHPSADFHEIMATVLRPRLRGINTPVAPTVSTKLFINGVVQTGQQLFAVDDGTLTGAGQWKLNGTDIAGQTVSPLTVPTVAAGDVITFEKDGETSNSITHSAVVYQTILDAANTTSKQITGGNLTQINDTSGNNRHAVPSTANGNNYVASTAPNNVTSVLCCTVASGQTLTYADSTARTGPRTIIFGFKAGVLPTGFKRLWGSGTNVEQNLWNVTNTQDVSVNAGTFATVTLAANLKWDDQPNLWVVRWDDTAGSATVWKNGGQSDVITNAGNNPGDVGYTLFGGDPSGGDNLGAADLYVFREFNGSLTNAEINAECADIPAQYGLPTWTTAI